MPVVGLRHEDDRTAPGSDGPRVSSHCPINLVGGERDDGDGTETEGDRAGLEQSQGVEAQNLMLAPR